MDLDNPIHVYLKMIDNYNHPVWPSPRAKLVAQKLQLDYIYHPDSFSRIKIKRLTHSQALELLRQRANKATVEEFLAMPYKEAWIALGCFTRSIYSEGKVAYDPLYGPYSWRY